MMTSQNNISSQTARQILIEAEQKGISVEIYLKKLADDFDRNGDKIFEFKSSSISYNFAETQNWLRQNARKYIGKWIVLDSGRLIGCGENPVPIVEKARKEGVKIPFVRFIEDDSKPFMGGWL